MPSLFPEKPGFIFARASLALSWLISIRSALTDLLLKHP